MANGNHNPSLTLNKEFVTKKVLECAEKYSKAPDLFEALQGDKELKKLGITIESITTEESTSEMDKTIGQSKRRIVKALYMIPQKDIKIKKKVDVILPSQESEPPKETILTEDFIQTEIESPKFIGKISLKKSDKEEKDKLPQKISIPLEKFIGGEIHNPEEFKRIIDNAFLVLHRDKRKHRGDQFGLDNFLKRIQTDPNLKPAIINNQDSIPYIAINQARLLRLDTDIPGVHDLQLCSKGLYDKIEKYCKRLHIKANRQNIPAFIEMFGGDPWEIIYEKI